MHKLFTLTILLKGINGVIEVIFGLLAVFITHDAVIYWVDLITRVELLNDPGDKFAQYLVLLAQQYSTDT